jgi:heme-degrading monooxygenase HmoA
MPPLYDWNSNMSIVKWTNSEKHRVITRTKAKHYFNGVFPDSTNKHHQFEYSDTDDEEVVTKK